MAVVELGNSPDKLHHPRSDAYSVQQVLLNKQQIWCGRAYLDYYIIMQKYHHHTKANPRENPATKQLMSSPFD